MWTLLDGAAGITAGCAVYAIGCLTIKGIRASARIAVATWQTSTPGIKPQASRNRKTERIMS